MNPLILQIPRQLRGSEWEYFDSTKHLFFWLYNIKRFIFSHFNTNIKKFANIIFFPYTNKLRPKRRNIYVGPMFIVSKRFFGHFPTIPMIATPLYSNSSCIIILCSSSAHKRISLLAAQMEAGLLRGGLIRTISFFSTCAAKDL